MKTTCPGSRPFDHDRPESGASRMAISVILGVEPEDVTAYVAVAAIKCKLCGEGHFLAINTDLDNDMEAMFVLSKAGLAISEGSIWDE
jgi:hypothetical protein